MSAHFTNRAITSDRQSPMDSEGYTSLSVLSRLLANIRMISETIDSGSLLAQAMDPLNSGRVLVVTLVSSKP